MPFAVRMGIPEMEDFWQDLESRASHKTLSKDEQ